MLEIGVSKGGSLALWRKALGDRVTIFGIDIDPKCAEFDGKFATVRIGSQDDAGFLKDVVREMRGVDIVLDDGSHVASHQRAASKRFSRFIEAEVEIADKAGEKQQE